MPDKVIERITREEAARRLFSGEWDELTAGEIRERYPLIERHKQDAGMAAHPGFENCEDPTHYEPA